MQTSHRFPTWLCVVAVVVAQGTVCSEQSDRAKTVVADAPRDTAMIDSLPTCASCSISIVDSVRIGAPTDAVIPTRPPGILRDGHGQLYLTFNQWSGQPILRYDSVGKYQGRVGATGKGPGEYNMSSTVLLDPFDSLFVFENGGMLGQVFTADGRYVRRADIGAALPFAKTRFDNGRTLAVRRSGFPRTEGPRFVLRYNIPGAVVDSFEIFSVATGKMLTLTAGPGQRWEIPEMLHSDAYAAPDGSTWTLSQTNYRLEQHDSNGVSRKLFGVRVAGELPPIMRAEDIKTSRPDGEPIPTRAVVRLPRSKRALRPQNWIDIDTTGLLWVTRQIAAPSWDTISPALQLNPNSEAPSEENLSMDVKDRLYHTVIEIIDPRGGQLLARLTLPFLGQRVGAGFVGRVTANEDGYLTPIVYRLRLQRP